MLPFTYITQLIPVLVCIPEPVNVTSVVVGTADTLNVSIVSEPIVAEYSPSTSPVFNHAGTYFNGTTTGAGGAILIY